MLLITDIKVFLNYIKIWMNQIFVRKPTHFASKFLKGLQNVSNNAQSPYRFGIILDNFAWASRCIFQVNDMRKLVISACF